MAVPAGAQIPDRADPPGRPQTSIVVADGQWDYEINGWQVRCGGSGRFSDCEARRPFFGPMEATIRVSDESLQFELQSSCVNPPANHRMHSWNRRQPISTIEVAREVLAALNEGARGCREEELSAASVYEISNLMFLFLQVVPSRL